MQLYFAPRTRATRPRWLLEELEEPYELVRLDPARAAAGEFPALVDGELTFFDASALCLLHLADRFPARQLAPAIGSAERARFYQCLAFTEGTLEPLVMELRQHAQLPEEAKPRQREQVERARPRLTSALEAIDRQLAGREFLVGSRFSAADVLLASVLHLAHALKLLDGHPRLFEYVLRHTRRPACGKAVS